MRQINIKYPIEDDKVNNFLFSMNTLTKDALTSNLFLLLLTAKNERYYQPDYGTSLRQFLFDPRDQANNSDIESEIRDTVKNFLPQLTIKRLQFFTNEDDRGNPLLDGEVQVVVDFVFAEDTFSDPARVSFKFR